MLYLILAESALEIIPERISGHPAVLNYAKRKGRPLNNLFLDRSYHHSAMKRLNNAEKRGRPDIVHSSLLQALGTPLNMRGKLRVCVHTIDDMIIEVNPEVRLPRNYDRFVSLLEQLYLEGRVPKIGEPLLMLRRGDLEGLIKTMNPEKIIVLTTSGKPRKLYEVFKDIADSTKILSVVGGFPAGDFNFDFKRLTDRSFRVFKEPLETSIIISRLIYQYEIALRIEY